MSRTKPRTSRPRADDDHGPLLGALLRLAHQAVVAEVARGLADAGFGDVATAHFAVTQALWDRPDGERATDLAAAARVTKQSMGALIDDLEAHGYVERVQDPSDRRAKLVRFTERGWSAAKTARSIVRGVEAAWSRHLGAKRIAALRDTLTELVGAR